MQVPAVCRASYLGQRQPAPAPAASAAAGRQQSGLLTPCRTGPASDGHKVPQPPKSCSLLQSEQRLLGMHGQQWAAKTPFAGFICCCFCLQPCTELRPRWCSGRGTNTYLPFVTRSTPCSPPRALPVFFTAPRSSCRQLTLM